MQNGLFTECWSAGSVGAMKGLLLVALAVAVAWIQVEMGSDWIGVMVLSEKTGSSPD